jgi:hypothetical protein
MVEDHNPIAGTIALNLFADCGDNARGFMSEDARSGMGAGGNFLEVCAANAAGVDTDEHLSAAGFRDRDGLHADVVHPAVHGG